MPRFSLRTLIVVMLLGGPVCACGWREWAAYRFRRQLESPKASFCLPAIPKGFANRPFTAVAYTIYVPREGEVIPTENENLGLWSDEETPSVVVCCNED